MINFSEIIQEIFCEKTRAILTIIAISWGTFSIAVILAVGEGLRLNFSHTMANAGNKLLAISPGVTSKNYRGMKANESIKFNNRDLVAIAALPNVVGVTSQYNFRTRLYYGKHNMKLDIRAVTPEYATVHNIKVGPKQRFLSLLDMQNRSAVIVMGAKVAEKLFEQGDDPIGKTVLIDNRPFMVIGIMQKKPQMASMDRPDERLSWIPASTYALLNNPDKIDLFAASYDDFKLLDQTKANIQKVIAFNHGADPKDSALVNFSDIAEEQAKVNRFFIGMQVFLGIIGGLTLLLAGIGIANVMYAAVKRSTRLIGIQMAFGATAKYIIFRYLVESLVATTVGGIIGIIMAVVFVYGVRLIPITGKLIEIIGKPEPVISFLVLAIVIVVLGITGLVAGLLPAFKAAKIDPAEALIYE